MKIIISLVSIILLSGCVTTQKLSTPEDIAAACSYEHDQYKQTETLLSPKINVDFACHYYYKWVRSGGKGDGVYAIRLYFNYPGDSEISELRNINGTILKPVQTRVTDVEVIREHVWYKHTALFEVSRDFLESIKGVQAYRIYTAAGLPYDLTFEQTHIEGFLSAVDAKRK